MEALARGPAGTPLYDPAELFAAARAMGLEPRLDLECLRRALWLLPLVPDGQRLFVNIGVSTLMSPHLESTLFNHLPTGQRKKVVLELIEGPIPCFELARSRMAWVRDLGIEVAIDDLAGDGTMLERLSRLGPVDYVKIDREVLMRALPEDPVGTRAWLEEAMIVSRRLGAELMVEGVEASSRPLLRELNMIGVELGQGYLFGQPVAARGLSPRKGGRERHITA
jgi:EAL domain-containing protein (putative c-di-GMP-specific phosphodiesterase class I)